MVNFDATKEDAKLIRDIARRVFDLVMDLEAVHCNGCPLDLQKLLDFPDFDFNHDVYKIRRFIDRTTGTLTECFLPRCAKPEDSSS